MQNALDNILFDVIKNFSNLKEDNSELNHERLIERFASELDNIPYPIVVSDVPQFKPAYLNKACRSYIPLSKTKVNNLDNRFYYQYVHNDSILIIPLGVSHFMNQPHQPYHVCYKIALNEQTHKWFFVVTHTLDYLSKSPINIKYLISAFVDIHDYINTTAENLVLNPMDKYVDMIMALKTLSLRERKMLSLFIQEHSIDEIAELMTISPNTVKTYRQKIMLKLGVKSGIGLGKFGMLNECIER